jgi:DNA-binding transcriptional LysR family regulator
LDAVLVAGTIGKAAARLSVTPAAISLHVRELEEYCGVPLFERVKRRLRITGAGEMLGGYARRIFALADEAEHSLALLKDFRHGRLRVAATGTAAASHLPQILQAFRTRYPGISIEVVVGNTRQVLDRLVARDSDIAIVGREQPHAELAFEPLVDDTMVAIVPPSHRWARKRRILLRDIAQEPLMLREPGSESRRLIEEEVARIGTSLNIAMELGANDAIIRAVQRGAGIGIMSRALTRDEVRSGLLHAIPIGDANLTRRLFTAYHRDRGHFTLIESFREIAQVIRQAGGLRPPSRRTPAPPA